MGNVFYLRRSFVGRAKSASGSGPLSSPGLPSSAGGQRRGRSKGPAMDKKNANYFPILNSFFKCVWERRGGKYHLISIQLP